MDPKPLSVTRQRHSRHPSQSCIKFSIFWRADHLPTGSCRNYNKESASSLRCTQTTGERQSLGENTVECTSIFFTLKCLRYHQTWVAMATPEENWHKGPPMCPLCSDKGEMGLDHTQRSHSLTDATDNVKTRYRWSKLSKLYWTARKKMEDISLTGVR